MKKINPAIRGIVAMVIAFFAYSIIQAIYILPTYKDMKLFVVSSIFAIGLTIFVIFIMWSTYKTQLKHANPRGFDQKPHFSWKNVGKSVLGVVAIIALQIIFGLFMGNAQPENQAEINKIISQSTVLFDIQVVIVAPIIEEIIFRGYLLNIILQKDTKINRIIAIIIGGLLFGLLHEPRLSMFLLVYAGMGSILTATYIYTKDLRYSILVHIINNSLSLM